MSNQNTGTDVDPFYGHAVSTSSEEVGVDNHGNGGSSSGDVNVTVSGPATDNPGDPQTQLTSNQIQIADNQHADDTYDNNTGAPFGVDEGEGNDIVSKTADKAHAYNYVINGGAAGGSTVTLTFTATLKGTASTANLFQETPSLDLEVGTGPMNQWLDVSISNQNGFVPTGTGVPAG